jgi:alpha-mannosidase
MALKTDTTLNLYEENKKARAQSVTRLFKMSASTMAACSDLNFEYVVRISLRKYDEHLSLKDKQVECTMPRV